MRAAFALSFLLTACGSSGGDTPSHDAATPPDAALPDGGVPDAPPLPDAAPLPDAPFPDGGGTITLLDWSQNRGAPLATTTVTVPATDLSAVHAGGFVTGDGCVEDRGCTYTWYDDAGAVQKVLHDARPVNSSIISPDGSKLLLMELAGPISDCGAQSQLVAQGTMRLLDVSSGDTVWSRAMRSNIWSNPAFSPSGRWFILGDIPVGRCDAPQVPMSVAAGTPHPTPDIFALDELPRDRYLAWRGSNLGVADNDGAFHLLGVDTSTMDIGGGWIHAAAGYSYYVASLTAYAEDGRMFTREVDGDATWRLRHVWERWSILCRDSSTGHPETCSMVDVTGEQPLRTLIINPTVGYHFAFLGKGASIAYVGPSGLERFDIAEAHTEAVAPGPGTMHRLGDGEALLWLAGGDVTLVEAGRAEPLLTGNVSEVIALPGPVGAGRATRQSRTAFIVQTFGVEDHRLWLFDYATRRLVRLSDRLYHAPHVGQPYSFDDCGVPRPMRSGGHPGDLLRQDASWAFFLELPAGGETLHAVFAVPLDLGAAPRKLGETMPVYCHAPKASPDGTRLLLEVDGFDGQTDEITLAAP